MLLQECIKSLVSSELANLSIGKPEWSTGKFSYTTLISCISLANIELHKRFSLKREYVTLQPILGVYDYLLDPKHAVSNTASLLDKYVIDTVGRPFSGSIAKIDQLIDHNNETINFNTTANTNEFLLLDYRTLRIVNPDDKYPIQLVCRSIPAPIHLVNEEALDTYELDLPYTYLEALLCYAAGRAYINRGAENATNNESAIFFARFEASCARIENSNLSNNQESSNTRFTMKGFV